MNKEMDPQFVNIRPSPRVLQTLGDIPFELWQCIAEIVDNSLDGFADARRRGFVIDEPRVDIHWSSEDVSADSRKITVIDNGPGMGLDALHNAAKAGYSGNDPIHNLGLFGMGFNIATAKMGDETIFWSATADAGEWKGIRINFDDLVKSGDFNAPVIYKEKKNASESGTQVFVTLKEDMYAGLRRKERAIRLQLERIYSPILGRGEISIYVMGKKLIPHQSCVWGANRFVTRKGERVAAVQEIDRDLGGAYFDTVRGRYLSENETMKIDHEGKKPDHVIERSRRLHGWLGVQRYCDTGDFGIDIVRNGRKILIRDKSLFEYENPDTGTFMHEYPVEYGSTTGGRIVGELHADYLIPTYQKNSFDRSGKSWRLTVDAVRGAGPLLPRSRKTLGHGDENTSPLGLLVNAYRRIDAGTKCLAIANATAKAFHREFSRNNSEYQTDEKWYKAAQEADRAKSEGSRGRTQVDTGSTSSADANEYLPSPEDAEPGAEDGKKAPAQSGVLPLPVTSETDDLIQRSERQELLSGKYAFNRHQPIEIIGRRITSGQIRKEGTRVPCLFALDGVRGDFFYDDTHPILAEYPLTPKQLLLHIVAEKFSIRDSSVSMQAAFLGLVENHLIEERINSQILQERAHSIIVRMRESMPGLLGHRFSAAKKAVQSAGLEEGLIGRLIQDEPSLVNSYQNADKEAARCLEHADETVVMLLVQTFPAEFLDGNFFDLPYERLQLSDAEAKTRLQQQSLKQVTSYLSDIVALLQGGYYEKRTRDELLRQSHTLSILEKRIVER